MVQMADSCRRHALATYTADNLERIQRVLETGRSRLRGCQDVR